MTKHVIFNYFQKEEERLKASIRRESQQRRMKERAHHRGMDRAYLEEDEDDEDSIAALKQKYKQKVNPNGKISYISFDLIEQYSV